MIFSKKSAQLFEKLNDINRTHREIKSAGEKI